MAACLIIWPFHCNRTLVTRSCSQNIPVPPVFQTRTSRMETYSLNQNLSRLALLFAMERATLRRMGGWLARIPYWDAKLAVGTHLWEDAQHAEGVLKRLHELKDLGAERRTHSSTERVLERAATAEHADAFLAGIYRVVKPWLLDRYEEHLRFTDPVMDAPTVALLENVVREKQQQIGWFAAYRPRYSPALDPGATREWQRTVRVLLDEVPLP